MSKCIDGVVVINCCVNFDYEIEEIFEVGLVLMGLEVKFLCEGCVNIVESYVSLENDEIWLINFDILIYGLVNWFNYDLCCYCKLLLKCCEIVKLQGVVVKEGCIIIVLCFFFNDCGMVKIFIGFVCGKKIVDKCQIIKDCDWNKQKVCLMKNLGQGCLFVQCE